VRRAKKEDDVEYGDDWCGPRILCVVCGCIGIAAG
jgi:hypothetical protein